MTFSPLSQDGLSPVTAPAILVVDDNAAKHLAIRAILEPLGQAIVAADSGEAALHAVLERPFAVILMDVQMPLMDGYETARFIRMRSDCEHTPIIFITAHSRDEAQVPNAYASGAVDFMFAPLDPAILCAKVSVFIELFKQSQELAQSLADVTKLSEQFRDNEARTRTILDHVADGIITVGDEGRIESFNAAASEIFGYTEPEAIGELVLHYQPKIDLVTKETIGVEALIRWNHPSGRLMMPGEFMPEVERTDLMVPITEWVVNEALAQLRAWRDLGYDITMAVNVGARCLAPRADLFEKIDALVWAWGIPPEKLTIELTESALLDTAVPEVREQLEHMGERLSIDDFGTGYSSLVYLQRLPVTEIKADRSFVTSMATEPDNAVIVRSTVDLAHNLSLKVVAEGVEDEATMDRLIEYGCDAAQGFYFSRPLTAPALTEWLETSSFGLPSRPQREPAPVAS